MKVLFLDIDGVINTGSAEVGFHWSNMKVDSDLSPSALYHLHEIIEYTGCKIVISSTWRHGESLETMKGWFLDPLISDAIIGKTPCFEFKEELKDKSGRVQRGEEIYWWVNEGPYKDEITRYAVLDDDNDMDAVRENFFITEPTDGLNNTTKKKVVEHLNYTEHVDHYAMNIAINKFLDTSKYFYEKDKYSKFEKQFLDMVRENIK